MPEGVGVAVDVGVGGAAGTGVAVDVGVTVGVGGSGAGVAAPPQAGKSTIAVTNIEIKIDRFSSIIVSCLPELYAELYTGVIC
jgi:hypothetical protein